MVGDDSAAACVLDVMAVRAGGAKQVRHSLCKCESLVVVVHIIVVICCVDYLKSVNEIRLRTSVPSERVRRDNGNSVFICALEKLL